MIRILDESEAGNAPAQGASYPNIQRAGSQRSSDHESGLGPSPSLMSASIGGGAAAPGPAKPRRRHGQRMRHQTHPMDSLIPRDSLLESPMLFTAPPYASGKPDAPPAQIVFPNKDVALGVSVKTALFRAARKTAGVRAAEGSDGGSGSGGGGNGRGGRDGGAGESLTLWTARMDVEDSVRLARGSLFLMAVFYTLYIYFSAQALYDGYVVDRDMGVDVDFRYDTLNLPICLALLPVLLLGVYLRDSVLMAAFVGVLAIDAGFNLVRQASGTQWGIFLMQVLIMYYGNVVRRALSPAWRHLPR